MGSFRVLLVDSGSASRVEVSKLLASCRYQVRRRSRMPHLLLCVPCAPPRRCAEAAGRPASISCRRIKKCSEATGRLPSCTAAAAHLTLVGVKLRHQPCDQPSCGANPGSVTTTSCLRGRYFSRRAAVVA